jgi:hypothetical protein
LCPSYFDSKIESGALGGHGLARQGEQASVLNMADSASDSGTLPGMPAVAADCELGSLRAAASFCSIASN